MKKILASMIFVYCTSAFGAITSGVQLDGYVSRILNDEIIVFANEELIHIPKSLVPESSKLKAGQTFDMEFTFDEIQNFARTEIPVVGPSAHARK